MSESVMNLLLTWRDLHDPNFSSSHSLSREISKNYALAYQTRTQCSVGKMFTVDAGEYGRIGFDWNKKFNRGSKDTWRVCAKRFVQQCFSTTLPPSRQNHHLERGYLGEGRPRSGIQWEGSSLPTHFCNRLKIATETGWNDLNSFSKFLLATLYFAGLDWNFHSQAMNEQTGWKTIFCPQLTHAKDFCRD